MKNNSTKERFIELRAAGNSYNAISEQLSVSKQTLINWSKELQHEIANFRQIELEALYQKHSVAKEQRIALFSCLLNKMSKELEKRDFSDLRTNDLLQMLLKYGETLKTECSDTTFSVGGLASGDIFHDATWLA